MSTKPSIVPRWAGTDPDTPANNVVEPTSGKKDTGYVTGGDKPTSGVLNWLFFWIYAWIQYLADGALRGAHSLQHDDEDTFTPVFVALDPSNGSRRTTIDHNGFRMGQVTERQETWFTSGTTDPAGWTFSNAGSGSRTYSDPSSDMPYRHVNLSTGTTDPSFAQLVSLPLTYISADRTFVMEGDLRTGNVVDAGTAMAARWGVQFSHGSAWDYGVWFQLAPDTLANVECFTSGSVTTDQFDSGVAIATNSTYRLRIEICGENNHDGSDAIVRFFINGTLVREFGFSNPPLNDIIRMWTNVSNNSTTNDYDVYVGPIRWGFNHRATPDNL